MSRAKDARPRLVNLVYKMFDLDQHNWNQMLFDKYLIVQPTFKFKVTTIWLYFLNVTCLVSCLINLAISNESASRTVRLLAGDLFMPIGIDGVKAVCISAAMGSVEILVLHTAWLYMQKSVRCQFAVSGTFRIDPKEFLFETTKRLALFQVTSAIPFFLSNGLILLYSSKSTFDTILVLVDIVYWVKIATIHFALFPIFAGYWLHEMKLWQDKLNQLYTRTIQLESSIDVLGVKMAGVKLEQVATEYKSFRRNFSRVNKQLSFYLRLVGFTSTFYTCSMTYMSIFVENFFIRTFMSSMNFMLILRLLLLQLTAIKVTRVNSEMYKVLTRIQARSRLVPSNSKFILLKMIQQIGFLHRPSLALSASSDGSAFVVFSIYSHLDKLVMFFLPLVTFMLGKSKQLPVQE